MKYREGIKECLCEGQRDRGNAFFIVIARHEVPRQSLGVKYGVYIPRTFSRRKQKEYVILSVSEISHRKSGAAIYFALSQWDSSLRSE